MEGLLGAASVEFREHWREEDASDGTLTLATLEHEVPRRLFYCVWIVRERLRACQEIYYMDIPGE